MDKIEVFETCDPAILVRGLTIRGTGLNYRYVCFKPKRSFLKRMRRAVRKVLEDERFAEDALALAKKELASHKSVPPSAA